MRVSDHLKQKRTQRTLARLSEQHQAHLEQAGTGKRVTTASDDPVAYERAKRARQEELRHEGYRANGERFGSLLRAADEALGQGADILTRVKELGVMAHNETLSQGQLGAIRQEVMELREALHQVANTTLVGEHVFAGTRSQAPAFDASGQYTGGPARETSVGPSATVKLPAGGEAFGGGGQSVFALLDRFAGQLGAQDFAGIRQSQSQLDQALDGVVASRQQVGAQEELVEQARAFSEAIGFGARAEQARVTEADFAQTLSTLQASRTGYEAALRLEKEMRTMTDLVLRF